MFKKHIIFPKLFTAAALYSPSKAEAALIGQQDVNTKNGWGCTVQWQW